MLHPFIHICASKKDFIALKADINKLDINKHVNVLSDLNDLNDLDVGKLKTIAIDLKNFRM